MKYNELKTEEYVVSFIDILGAAKKIKENADDSLNQVHNVYTNSLKYLEEITQIINVNNKVFVEKLFIRIFSDNIVIAASAKESVDIAFLQVVAFTAIIQQEFLQASVLVRGGISIGNFYYDDVMIWGKALVEAYTVESTIAIYPRVVITPELIDKLKFRSWHGIDQFITVDMDGLLFVDYISNHYFKKIKSEELNYYFSSVLSDCQKMCIEANGNIRILQKIKWHQNYLIMKRDEFVDNNF